MKEHNNERRKEKPAYRKNEYNRKQTRTTEHTGSHKEQQNTSEIRKMEQTHKISN